MRVSPPTSPLARASLVMAIAAALASCSAGERATEPVIGASVTIVGATLTVTSDDFADGGYLDARHSNTAFGGQCSGKNLNPQLSWSGAPGGTETYAIVALDRSAGDFVHWIQANIPAEITSVATGAGADLPGVPGRNTAGSDGYFGPCPPGPDHRYEFQIWALDDELPLGAGPTFADLVDASTGHVLARGSITGIFFPPEG